MTNVEQGRAGGMNWLSVLVPVFNVEPYLEECLASVIAQVEQLGGAQAGVEVLVLDDCSTDGSAALMQALARRWPGQLRLMAHERNQGLSAARNSMIDAATGEYLWFLDSDDKLLPGSLSALQGITRTHAPDVVLCDFQVWRERMTLKHRLRGELHRSSFDGAARGLLSDRCSVLADVLMPGELHAWSKISRRSLWADDLRFPVGQYFEDMATMPLMMLRASSFYYADQPWVAYRQRATSILATPNLGKAIDQARALVAFRAALEGSGCAGDARLQLALAHQSARNFIGAMRYLDGMQGSAAERQGAMRTVRESFAASSPLAPDALCKAYGSRGWWLRRAKLRQWLKAAAMAGIGS